MVKHGPWLATRRRGHGQGFDPLHYEMVNHWADAARGLADGGHTWPMIGHLWSNMFDHSTARCQPWSMVWPRLVKAGPRGAGPNGCQAQGVPGPWVPGPWVPGPWVPGPRVPGSLVVEHEGDEAVHVLLQRPRVARDGLQHAVELGYSGLYRYTHTRTHKRKQWPASCH